MVKINILFLICTLVILGQLLLIKRCPNRKILYNLSVASSMLLLLIYYTSDLSIMKLIMIFTLIIILNIVLLVNCNNFNPDKDVNQDVYKDVYKDVNQDVYMSFLNNINNEGFVTSKMLEIKEFHKPLISNSFKLKLEKRRSGKNGKKNKENFNDTTSPAKSFRDDIYEYYNSFKKTPISKWSNNTKESFSKLKIFKDKLYEII